MDIPILPIGSSAKLNVISTADLFSAALGYLGDGNYFWHCEFAEIRSSDEIFFLALSSMRTHYFFSDAI